MFEGKWLKPIVLEVVIEIDLKTFKHDTDVAVVSEALICTHKVELLRVHFTE